jgi:uncharacterized protein YebE (UPF0316 family)
MNLDFLNDKSIWIYLFIFFGKIAEVSVATVRMVLINRGERTKGSIIAFFEICLWLMVTGTVLAGFTEDFIKVIVFCFAFAIGNYVGSWIEGKIALGLSTIQVITNDDESACIAESLRTNNLAVTVIEGQGKNGNRKILMVHLKRNRIAATVKLINALSDKCVITMSDVKVIRGGFIKK